MGDGVAVRFAKVVRKLAIPGELVKQLAQLASWQISQSLSQFIPQQRKLMGSSAQISSGVCRCGSQEQVPEAGSGRFRRVPGGGAGVGSGGGFRKVPESSGVCWCRFRRQVPESSGMCWSGSGGKSRKVAGSASSEKFRRVLL